MENWSSAFEKVNGQKIHYYRTGGNKPQVVINHGAGDDGLCWTHVAKSLEQDYDVILPDARGHGKSGSGKGDYSTRQRTLDLAQLIQKLSLDRPVVGGHSMGADTTLHLAAEYPQLTRGIFLEDPPIILPGETFGDGTQTIDPAEIGKMMANFMRMFKLIPAFAGRRMARKASPLYPDDEIIPWVNSKKRLSFDFLKSMAAMRMDLLEPEQLIRRVTVPVLLFIGEKSKMSIMSEEAANLIANANDLVQVRQLKDASHDIRRTRFDGYMPALKDFLTSIYSS